VDRLVGIAEVCVIELEGTIAATSGTFGSVFGGRLTRQNLLFQPGVGDFV
jgi:hypothetical protein